MSRYLIITGKQKPEQNGQLLAAIEELRRYQDNPDIEAIALILESLPTTRGMHLISFLNHFFLDQWPHISSVPSQKLCSSELPSESGRSSLSHMQTA